MDEENEINPYEIIARQINSPTAQCVLLLGPELAVDKKGLGYKSYFRSILPAGSRYFDAENLFQFKEKSASYAVTANVVKYYKEVGDPALMEMISRIPFPLIINVAPDKAINKVLKDKGIEFSEGHFSKESKSEFNPTISIPSKKKPVVYNMFGSVDVEQSLILTHKKLYESIEYLLPDNSLPDNIELFLKSTATSFVFLGFKFDSWHYQLICHKLGINVDLESKTNICSPEFMDNENVSVIMSGIFDMKFVPENPMQCIHNIIEACELDNPQSLREKNPNGAYSTFASYARNDGKNENRENVVDLIQSEIEMRNTNNVIQFFRDRIDLKHGDSIDSYMTHIGIGKAVVRVISHKYLTSIYCMIEAFRMRKYNDKDKRILTIVMEDADIHSADSVEKYKNYWFLECQKILKDSSKLNSGDYDDCVSIYRYIDKFIKTVTDEVYLALNYDDISKDASGKTTINDAKKEEFNLFIDQIFLKMKQD